MTISVTDVTTHHASATASRNAKEKKQLTNEVSKVLDRALTLANSSHLPFDERLDAIKAMTNNSSTAASSTPGALSAGSGASPEDVLTQALAVVGASPLLSEGHKHVIRRSFSKGTEPDHLFLEADGTPTELKQATDELRKERDVSNPGSLAFRLKEAEDKLAAASATSGGSSAGLDVDAAVEKIESVINDLEHLGQSAFTSKVILTDRNRRGMVKSLTEAHEILKPAPAPPSSTP